MLIENIFEHKWSDGELSRNKGLYNVKKKLPLQKKREICDKYLAVPMKTVIQENIFKAIAHQSCGSLVVKASDHGRHVPSSSPVPLKTLRVGQRCTLNLSRAETRPPDGVVVMRGGASSDVVHVT
ncbi:hypothetical protein TNCV_1625191 [Trichonephila clavipes]|nr:hypothetical protein TNCV_1625191 [Trichonephila clavipes]